MFWFRRDSPAFLWWSWAARFAALSLVSLVSGALLLFIASGFSALTASAYSLADALWRLSRLIASVGRVFIAAAFACALLSVICRIFEKPCTAVERSVRRSLCDASRGNPLHLRDGEELPRVRCRETPEGFEVDVSAASFTVDEAQAAASLVSSGFRGRYSGFAVVNVDSDPAFGGVTFIVADVMRDRTIKAGSFEDLASGSPTLIRVQQGTNIDLTTSGSMIFAGATRSGKTTAAMTVLGQCLSYGRDDYGSRIVIVDPKSAELSRLPGVVTPDEDGGGRAILAAMRDFEKTMRSRQQRLNDLSESGGDAVKWWDAGMHVSLLFLDEYVSLRTLFPKRESKEEPGYSLAAFDDSLRRIVTMGASAGCYALVSIAQASVGDGGLPSMLRDAMSTRVLMRPTREQASLLWVTSKFDCMAPRVYLPGDAWFTSTDGVHDRITVVHFPELKFSAYRELARLICGY